jgi:hypothetical protein
MWQGGEQRPRGRRRQLKLSVGVVRAQQRTGASLSGFPGASIVVALERQFQGSGVEANQAEFVNLLQTTPGFLTHPSAIVRARRKISK